MNTPTTENTALLSGGGAEYALEEAACSINELIDALQTAKDDGFEFVVMSSGNYRGAQWASIRPTARWIDE